MTQPNYNAQRELMLRKISQNLGAAPYSKRPIIKPPDKQPRLKSFMAGLLGQDIYSNRTSKFGLIVQDKTFTVRQKAQQYPWYCEHF